MEWLLVKTVLSLAAVLALMLGLAWLLRRTLFRGGAARPDAVPVELLGQRAIQPKRSVVVLRVLDRVIVVGLSEHGMHPLSEIDGAAAPDAAQLAPPRSAAAGWESIAAGLPPGVASFASHLHRAVGSVVPRPRRARGAEARKEGARA